MTAIRTLTQKSIKAERPINVLCFFYDGFFERDLTKLGCNIFGSLQTSILPFNNFKDYSPPSLRYLPDNFNAFGHDVTFDMILCNDRTKQYEQAKMFATAFHTPIIVVDHQTYAEQLNPANMTQIENNTPASRYISCTTGAYETWNTEGNLIPYGIDDLSGDDVERNIDYLIIGKFLQNELHEVKSLQDQIGVQVWGHNKDFSVPFEYYLELVNTLKRTKVFINLGTHTGIPRELLMAMSAGCGIVTNHTSALKYLLKDRENALMYWNMEEIIPYSNTLMNDTKMRKSFADQNHSIIKNSFSTKTFMDGWGEVLSSLQHKAMIL